LRNPRVASTLLTFQIPSARGSSRSTFTGVFSYAVASLHRLIGISIRGCCTEESIASCCGFARQRQLMSSARPRHHTRGTRRVRASRRIRCNIPLCARCASDEPARTVFRDTDQNRCAIAHDSCLAEICFGEAYLQFQSRPRSENNNRDRSHTISSSASRVFFSIWVCRS